MSEMITQLTRRYYHSSELLQKSPAGEHVRLAGTGPAGRPPEDQGRTLTGGPVNSRRSRPLPLHHITRARRMRRYTPERGSRRRRGLARELSSQRREGRGVVGDDHPVFGDSDRQHLCVSGGVQRAAPVDGTTWSSPIAHRAPGQGLTWRVAAWAEPLPFWDQDASPPHNHESRNPIRPSRSHLVQLLAARH